MKKVFITTSLLTLALCCGDVYSQTTGKEIVLWREPTKQEITEYKQTQNGASVKKMREKSRKLRGGLENIVLTTPAMQDAWNDILKSVKDSIHETRTQAETLYQTIYNKVNEAKPDVEEIDFVTLRTMIHYNMVDELVKQERKCKQLMKQLEKVFLTHLFDKELDDVLKMLKKERSKARFFKGLESALSKENKKVGAAEKQYMELANKLGTTIIPPRTGYDAAWSSFSGNVNKQFNQIVDAAAIRYKDAVSQQAFMNPAERANLQLFLLHKLRIQELQMNNQIITLNTQIKDLLYQMIRNIRSMPIIYSKNLEGLLNNFGIDRKAMALYLGGMSLYVGGAIVAGTGVGIPVGLGIASMGAAGMATGEGKLVKDATKFIRTPELRKVKKLHKKRTEPARKAARKEKTDRFQRRMGEVGESAKRYGEQFQRRIGEIDESVKKFGQQAETRWQKKSDRLKRQIENAIESAKEALKPITTKLDRQKASRRKRQIQRKLDRFDKVISNIDEELAEKYHPKMIDRSLESFREYLRNKREELSRMKYELERQEFQAEKKASLLHGPELPEPPAARPILNR